MSLYYNYTDQTSTTPRELRVEIDYHITAPDRPGQGDYQGSIEIEQATVTEIDGRTIVGDPYGDYMTPEATAESEWFEGLIKSDAVLREKIELLICEREYDRQHDDGYERGAE